MSFRHSQSIRSKVQATQQVTINRNVNPAGIRVAVKLGSDIERDVENIQPNESLVPRTSYRVEVNSKLIDKEGSPIVPFRSTFTMGASCPLPVAREGFRYSKIEVAEEHGPTAIAVGPVRLSPSARSV
jgi:hypothetical protein